MLKADLTQSEVLPTDPSGQPNPYYPHDGQCKSGHTAPSGTRFFLIQGRSLAKERWGAYCEPCLKEANRMAAERRSAK